MGATCILAGRAQGCLQFSWASPQGSASSSLLREVHAEEGAVREIWAADRLADASVFYSVAPPGAGWSEFQMIRVFFHEPSGCRCTM